MSKPSTSVPAGAPYKASKLHNTWVYMKHHWQLYLLFIMPAFLLTVIFRYIPMGGVAIDTQGGDLYRSIEASALTRPPLTDEPR